MAFHRDSQLAGFALLQAARDGRDGQGGLSGSATSKKRRE